MTSKDDFLSLAFQFAPDMPISNHERGALEQSFTNLLVAGEFESLLKEIDDAESNVRWVIAAYGCRLRHQKCIQVLQEFVEENSLRFISSQVLQRVDEGAWDGYYDEAQTREPVRKMDSPREYSQPDLEGRNVLEFALTQPHSVPLGDIPEYSDHLDIRIGAVKIFFVNLASVSDGRLHFHPSTSESEHDELLAWLWLINPDLESAILAMINNQEFANYVQNSIPSRDLFRDR